MHIDFDEISRKYDIVEIVELNKGFSKDKKYILKGKNKKYILRLSDIQCYEFKKKQYELLIKLGDALNCSKVIEFGYFDKTHCYFLTTIIDGVDAIDVVKMMNEEDAYATGIKAGKTLKNWHATDVDTSNTLWYDLYVKKQDRIVTSLLECGCSIPLQEKLLTYYTDKIYLMRDRPIVFCHGDYHLGNMVIQDGELGIIDVVNCSLADPYEEFKRSYWSIMANEFFQTGLVNGYFNNRIPDDFFEILKFYSIESMITRILRSNDKEDLKDILKINEYQVEWWGNFDYAIPTWYKGIF